MRRSALLASAAIFLAAALSSPGQAEPRYFYGEDCRDQNTTAGAVIGAILGGILGSQFGRGAGNTAATFGGVILGGLAGASIAKDISCSDRPYAFRAYAQGFDGPIGRRYDWQNDRRTSYGYFRPTREYHNGAMLCREFQEDGYVNGRHYSRSGSACRRMDGNWHFN
ncbi:MAG TPA: glycine zipper 2TM domain-containing protein [Rhizomicrobium sp.]|nr:glycine zipper 2TM domain-containing protein [Rhizomicrobium sp.]